MTKLILLKIDNDQYEILIEEENINLTGKLPPTEKLFEHYQSWHSLYSTLMKMRMPKFKESKAVNEETLLENCQDSAKAFEEYFVKKWLVSLEKAFFPTLKATDEPTIVLIQTENLALQKLPWHKWTLFGGYIGLCHHQDFEIPTKCKANVDILAIFGTKIDPQNHNKKDLKVEIDHQLLKKNLENLEVNIDALEEPTKSQLSEKLEEGKWDILFFAGHSSSKEGIQINSKECVKINIFEKEFKKVGLQLAIFNSCDGLEIAKELAKIHKHVTTYITTFTQPGF